MRDLKVFDKVLYKMNYNGVTKYYNAIVIDVNTLELCVIFDDGFKLNTKVGDDQLQYIKEDA